MWAPRAAALSLGYFVTPLSAEVNATEIAPGVIMPLVNLGGIRGKPSNHTLWLDLGGRGLDTALMYGDSVEEEVAVAVLKTQIPREELFITTKIPCCPSSINSYYCQDPAHRDPVADIKHTFQVLNLDYVDLFLLHMPCDSQDDTLAAYRALEPLIEQQKARAIGISNFNASAMDALLKADLRVRPAVNQNGFSIGNHDSSWMGQDMETLASCQEQNITFSAYSPLGGLSHVDVLHNPIVAAMARKYNRSTAQIALRWLVQQGIVIVTATDKRSHQESDLDVFDFALSDDDMQVLLEVGEPVQTARYGRPMPMVIFTVVLSLVASVGCAITGRHRRKDRSLIHENTGVSLVET